MGLIGDAYCDPSFDEIDRLKAVIARQSTELDALRDVARCAEALNVEVRRTVACHYGREDSLTVEAHIELGPARALDAALSRLKEVRCG